MTELKQKKLDKLFMETAYKFAELSTCNRLKVGCVITKDNRICSSGYNGTPAGAPNCDEINSHFTYNNDKALNAVYMPSWHHNFSNSFEVHAEMNAIIDMAKRGLSPEGCTLYVTIAPCKNCAKLVVASGITRVVYGKLYDRDGEGRPVSWETDQIYNEDLNGINIINLLKSEIKTEVYQDAS